MNEVNKAPFINRKYELEFLEKRISEEPKGILFIYGPKSSGKTTLINKFAETKVGDKKFEFKFINLREVFISGYKDFLKAFFGIDDSAKKEDIKSIKQVNLKVFKLTQEVLNGLEKGKLDPFVVMKKSLEKINKKGKRPVLIIDELQALEDIYLNGQRLLIKELFNFFVAMTKEAHLCHVLICGSDGYFMERIDNDSRLRKAGDFFKIDYLTKNDVMYWLDNIDKESNIKTYSLNKSQKEAIWKMFGGSMWEISRFLGDLLLYEDKGRVGAKDFAAVIEKRKVQMRSHFKEYAGINSGRQKLCLSMHKEMQRKGFFELTDFTELIAPDIFKSEEAIREELRKLVSNNFIAYDPVNAQYEMQGKSMEHGLKMYADEIDR